MYTVFEFLAQHVPQNLWKVHGSHFYLLECFWLRQELRKSVCPSVRPSGTSLSKALNLHLFLIGQS